MCESTKKQKSKICTNPILFPIYIQGVLLPDRQTLGGDSRHEDKRY